MNQVEIVPYLSATARKYPQIKFDPSFIVKVGRRYVSSPTSKLTDNESFAAVMSKKDAEQIAQYWERIANDSNEIEYKNGKIIIN